jgi:hypothetical protein
MTFSENSLLRVSDFHATAGGIEERSLLSVLEGPNDATL